MNPPVILSETDLTHLLWVAQGNPCRDDQAQLAMLDAAKHLDSDLVCWTVLVEDTWEWTPCPVCDRPVPRNAVDAVCGACRDERAEDQAAWEARTL